MTTAGLQRNQKYFDLRRKHCQRMQANNIKTAILMSTQLTGFGGQEIKNETGVDFIEDAKSRYPECKFVVLSSSSTAKDFEKAIKQKDGYILNIFLRYHLCCTTV